MPRHRTPRGSKIRLDDVVGNMSKIRVDDMVSNVSKIRVDDVVGNVSKIRVDDVVGNVSKIRVDDVVGNMCRALEAGSASGLWGREFPLCCRRSPHVGRPGMGAPELTH
jgi:hypothetical protein